MDLSVAIRFCLTCLVPTSLELVLVRPDFQVDYCLVNLDMSRILTDVRKKSGNSLNVREMLEKLVPNDCGFVISRNYH